MSVHLDLLNYATDFNTDITIHLYIYLPKMYLFNSCYINRNDTVPRRSRVEDLKACLEIYQRDFLTD